MFCPEGYVSLAELWDQYQEKRLRDFYDSASEHYAKEDFEVVFVRGSEVVLLFRTGLRLV